MNKEEIIEILRGRNIDPISLERELVTLLRGGASLLDVEARLRRTIEGEVKR